MIIMTTIVSVSVVTAWRSAAPLALIQRVPIHLFILLKIVCDSSID
jgi:hypothetical protein